MRRSIVLVFLAALCWPAPSHAAQLGDPDDWFSLEIHGFATQGAFVTTNGTNFLSVNSTHGSVEFTELGLNVTKQITDKLRFGAQLFAQRVGAQDDIITYAVKADWFYLDYHWQDWLGLRAGRTKLPFGLYNDTSDIDAARVPILLPQAMYPLSNREVLLAQTGAELYGYQRIGPAGALDYRIYGGTILIDNPPTNNPVQITSESVPYIVGGRLLWETPLDGLRFGGSVQALRLDTVVQFPGTPAPPAIKLNIPYVLWVASAEYAKNNLLLAAEYGRWTAATDSSNTALIPHETINNERAYVMAAYRVLSWLHPGVYYSMLFPNAGQYKTRADELLDFAATLRFDIIQSHWIAKAEAHYFIGTASLDTTLNDNKPLTALANNWALFMATTTVYF